MEAIKEQDQLLPTPSDVDSLQSVIGANEGKIAGYHTEVLDGEDGVYLMSNLPESALDISIDSITPEETLALGASDSHHEVSFGKIDITNKELETASMHVAIKKFEDEVEPAVTEAENLQAMEELGFDALTPLAIVKSENDAYLITAFRPDIKTMDNENWTPRPGEEGHDTVLDNLRFIAESLGEMHGKGVFFGDAQPKNFARSDTGRSVKIDMEEGIQVAEDHQQLVELFNGEYGDIYKSAAYTDLRTLWATFNRPIGLRDENILLGRSSTSSELYEAFFEGFVEPYVDKLKEVMLEDKSEDLNFEAVLTVLNETVQRDLRFLPPDRQA